LSAALAIVAVIALGTFGLVLILARRLRAVTERVNIFLPASPGTLPHPGTPFPDFEAVSADGEHLSRAAFAGVDRIFAVLSTECGPCEQQVAAFRKSGADLEPRAIVAVVGPAQSRAAMVTELDGHAVVIEEPEYGPVAQALEISEFPAVLLVKDGVIQLAGHALAEVLPALPVGAASAPANS
jgi:hypothetical protein